MILKDNLTAVIANGETTSNQFNFASYTWAMIETPDAMKAIALTIQVLSGDGSTWIDAITVDDETNRIKGLTAAELAIMGAIKIGRLKVASAVTGAQTYYIHAST